MNIILLGSGPGISQSVSPPKGRPNERRSFVGVHAAPFPLLAVRRFDEERVGGRRFSINAEILRLNHEPDPEHAGEFIIVQQAFAVAVVILEEKILVFVVVEFIAQFDACIEAQPGFSFGQDQSAVESAVVGTEIAGQLEDAFIFEQVFIIFSVDDRNPDLELCFPVFVQYHGGSQCHAVPTAGGGAVAAVRFVLDHQVAFSDIFIMPDDEVAEADAGVEVHIVHGQRFLEYVPEVFLGILDK